MFATPPGRPRPAFLEKRFQHAQNEPRFRNRLSDDGRMVTRRGFGGRPSKGPRDSMRLRPPVGLGNLVRQNAVAAGMTNGDYCISLIDDQINVSDFEPGAGAPAYIGPLDSIFIRPPIDLAVRIRENADEAGMSISAYCVVLMAQNLEREDFVAPAPIFGQEVLPLQPTG